MTEQYTSPVITFYKDGWENYQRAITQTITALSDTQLALPSASHYSRSIGELVTHMISARIAWFCGWMDEGDLDLSHWNKDEQDMYSAEKLVTMLEQTWQVISAAMTHWTAADMQQVFSAPAHHQAWLRAQGLAEEPPHTRQWIVWHVLEHEIHHGGELSLALGAHGIASFYTW